MAGDKDLAKRVPPFRIPIHKLSFDFSDPLFAVGSYRFAFRVVTLDNTYRLATSKTRRREMPGGFRIEADGFESADGTAHPGHLTVDFKRSNDGWRWTITARHAEPILRLQTIIKDVPPGRLATIEDLDGDELAHGEAVFIYPSHRFRTPGYRTLPSALLFVRRADGTSTFIRSLETTVNRKIFSVFEESESFRIEATYEGDATKLGPELTAPAWVLGETTAVEAVGQEHIAMFGNGQRWETRTNVPSWARSVALVATLHGTHWTGHHFLTFEQQLEALRKIAFKIEGKRILAYLAGWDGRYYYDYPKYQADPGLGGFAGLRRLVDGAHDLGVHVMPMLCANVGNSKHLAKLGLEDAVIRSPWGTPKYLDHVDWNADGYPEEYPFLNPGHPGYQAHMIARSRWLIEEAGVDGVFLDISQFWENDPRFRCYEGLAAICASMASRYPNALVMGEGWYDALIRDFGIFQLWPWTKWPTVFEAYSRTMYYLPDAEPSRGSAGVHEWGTLPFQAPDPNRDAIPTLGIVAETFTASGGVDEVVQAAIAYAKRKQLD